LFKYNSHFSAWCKKISRKADCRQRAERERARLMPTTKQAPFGVVWGKYFQPTSDLNITLNLFQGLA